MLDVVKKVKKKTYILQNLLPILSFIIPLLVLYSLYPKSFTGDPTWEGNWQGRFFYIFFLWMVSLETILNWEKLQTSKVNKLKSIRGVAFIVALLLPTIYVIVANYCGLNSIIADLTEQNNVPQQYARLMPLSTEYLVFTVFFALMIVLVYGINGLTDFSMSTPFLGIIGILYTIDILYPTGRFTPLQILVAPTATLAASFLNFLGYQTSMSVSTHPVYGLITQLNVEDSMGRSACPFGIAWPCAGVESLLIYTVMILFFLKKTTIPWIYRVIYFVIGGLVTYFINVLRIVAIFVISIPCESPQAQANAMRFHNIYGQLLSITWIMCYPLIIIGSRILWRKISRWKTSKRGVDDFRKTNRRCHSFEIQKATSQHNLFLKSQKAYSRFPLKMAKT